MGDLGGVKEAMCVKDRVILLDQSRSMIERRCDLAHAVAHIELGHTDRRNKADERAAVRYAAKMLIDLDDLADAIETSAGLVDECAAAYLNVDMETLAARVEYIHPAERGYLRRRLSALSAGTA